MAASAHHESERIPSDMSIYFGSRPPYLPPAFCARDRTGKRLSLSPGEAPRSRAHGRSRSRTHAGLRPLLIMIRSAGYLPFGRWVSFVCRRLRVTLLLPTPIFPRGHSYRNGTVEGPINREEKRPMKLSPWGIGIALVSCAMAIGCVTYSYQPVPTRPVMSEAPPPPAAGSDQPFYDDLTPYGKWVQAAGSGWVWAPYNVEADWRPYEVGHWVFTDYGWTWASDEPYGWAVYHYGRWDRDSRYGWVWVPGTEWGPAWVAWHEGGGYVGWAPLPSQVRVQVGIGLDWGGVNVSLEPASWCFVSARNLVDPGLRGRIEPRSRNGSLIQVTQNITNYTYINNRVVNQGVRVDSIGRAVGHAIPHYRIAESESAEATRGGKVRGQDFVVFRPEDDEIQIGRAH